MVIIDTATLQQDVDDMVNLSNRWRILNAGLGFSSTIQQKLQGIQNDLANQMQDQTDKRLQEAEAFVRRLHDEKDETNQDAQQEEDRPGLHHLSMVSQLQSNKKYAEAEALAQQILQNTEERYGPKHMMVAPTLTSLSRLYQQQAKHREAAQCYQRVLGMYEDLYGSEHSHTTSTLSLLASALIDAGNDEEAEKICRSLLALAEEHARPEHAPNPLPLRGLARICLKQGRYEEAENYARRLLHILQQKWGSEHIGLCEALGMLARATLCQRRYVEANLFYRQALAISGTRATSVAPASRQALEQWENELKHDYRTWLHNLQNT